MTRAPHRLPRWQRLSLYVTGTVLLATGALWLAVHYGRSDDALPSPMEPWSMRLHGLAGFAALFLFGALAAAHIPQGWRVSHRMRWAPQRGTGLALCALVGLLALTGYLLYYFAPEGVRAPLGWLHSATGLAVLLLVLVHRRRHHHVGHSK